MSTLTQQELLDAGVHFGHLRQKWNPRMLPYIYAERKGMHIIDLNKTRSQLEKAAHVMRALARDGKTILFVATKKHAKQIVADCAVRAGIPHVTERWLGGMLTNHATVKRSFKKLKNIEKRLSDGTLETITKKERLQLQRSKEKMERVFGGILSHPRMPDALFLVDIGHEHIALAEAKKLNIQTIGMVDTNCDPGQIHFPIASNDDSSRSIALIVNYLTDAIIQGMKERKKAKSELSAKDAPAGPVEVDDENREIRVRENEQGENAS